MQALSGAADEGAMPRLRRATPDDLDLLVRHRRAMFVEMAEGHAEASLDAADPVYRAWAARRLRTGRLVGFVVEERGEAVASGCVWVKRIHPRPGLTTRDEPYLLSMYTEPAHRGKGHAERIARAAIAWSLAGGYPRITLHASEMGRPLYERLGFERRWEMRLDLSPSSRPTSPASTRRAGSPTGSGTARRTPRTR